MVHYIPSSYHHNKARYWTFDWAAKTPCPLGDIHARSPVWGDGVTNDKGQLFEEWLLNQNIAVLNNNLPTHYYIQTGTSSVIDLSICLSDSLLDFDYSIMDSLHDSDHYPIKITPRNDPSNFETTVRFKTNKNWLDSFWGSHVH